MKRPRSILRAVVAREAAREVVATGAGAMEAATVAVVTVEAVRAQIGLHEDRTICTL